MTSSGEEPIFELEPQGRRRRSMFQRWGVPPPQIGLHPDRGMVNNVRTVRDAADEHGRVCFIAYGRTGKRALNKIRFRLHEEYSTTMELNNEKQNPDRYRREQYRMWVTRIGGPTKKLGYGNPQERAIRALRRRDPQDPATPDNPTD
ncbi:MAG: hypothetical protein ABIJ48_03130 [Actinomycetota bacterium]